MGSEAHSEDFQQLMWDGRARLCANRPFLHACASRPMTRAGEPALPASAATIRTLRERFPVCSLLIRLPPPQTMSPLWRPDLAAETPVILSLSPHGCLWLISLLKASESVAEPSHQPPGTQPPVTVLPASQRAGPTGPGLAGSTHPLQPTPILSLL